MNKKNLTRKEIGRSIYKNLGISKNLTENIVENTFKIISENLQKNSTIKIAKFGVFKILNKKERIGRNPKTKIETKIPARKVVSFKSSKHLIKEIND